MLQEIERKLNGGEKLDEGERIYLNVAAALPGAESYLSVDYVGQRAQRTREWYFEARRSGGRVLVRAAYETWHPRAEEITAQLIEAVRQLRVGSTSAALLRMRIPT